METPPTLTFCREYVGQGVVNYPCLLPLGHEGPHAAQEVAVSMRKRQQWEEAQQARATLAQFQGEARTTAQSLTANPSPVPGAVPTPPPFVGDGFDVFEPPIPPERQVAAIVDTPQFGPIRVFTDFTYEILTPEPEPAPEPEPIPVPEPEDEPRGPLSVSESLLALANALAIQQATRRGKIEAVLWQMAGKTFTVPDLSEAIDNALDE